MRSQHSCLFPRPEVDTPHDTEGEQRLHAHESRELSLQITNVTKGRKAIQFDL